MRSEAADRPGIPGPEPYDTSARHRAAKHAGAAADVRLDLLAELLELLAAKHGPVSEEHLAWARAAWPDDEQPWPGCSFRGDGSEL
jgi:hypothetical protein